MLKRLNLNDDARDVLVEATRAEPCHWGAWLELSGHISERSELTTLQLPDHWMKHFFLAHTYLELQGRYLLLSRDILLSDVKVTFDSTLDIVVVKSHDKLE